MTTAQEFIATGFLKIGNKLKNVHVYSNHAYQELNRHNVELIIFNSSHEKVKLDSRYYSNLVDKASVN